MLDAGPPGGSQSPDVSVSGPGRGGRLRLSIRARLACLLAAVIAAGLGPALVPDARRWAFDTYQHWSPLVRATPSVLIVDIDAASVRSIGRWPWPRDRLASLITALHAATVIGVDILLLEPDRSGEGQADRVLADELTRAKIVLAASEEATQSGCTRAPQATPIFEAGEDPRRFIPRLTSVAWPLPLFLEAASAAGPAVALLEPDGVLRRLPTIYACGNARCCQGLLSKS